MDIQPNENLIISLPEVRVGEKEKVSVSNIDKQYVCFQLEVHKDQFKSVYLEMKIDYTIDASKENETIRLKRIKFSVPTYKETEAIRRNEEIQNSIKFVRLLQKKAGLRFNYYIPTRFMIKIHDTSIENDYYRKVFFREGIFKVQLIANTENVHIWFYDLDSIEFNEPIDEKLNSKKIITIDSIGKNVKAIFDDVSKEIGYWVILEKTLEAGLKLGSLFKRKGKVKNGRKSK